MMIRLLIKQFYLDNIYIPPRLAGDKLPEAIFQYYQDLTEKARERLLQEEAEKEPTALIETEENGDAKNKPDRASVLSGYK